MRPSREETGISLSRSRFRWGFRRRTRESCDGPLPKYVKEEFRKHLECGDFSRDFVHVQCPVCHEDKAVAFSCKLRGLCPSCAGRLEEESAKLQKLVAQFAMEIDSLKFALGKKW